MSILYLVLALVAAQRLAELAFAAVNTRRLRAQGAVELDAGLYPCFVLLHAAWLAAIALLVPATAQPSWPALVLYALLQPARLWAIAALGRRWTTRLIVLPGAPLVCRGPYRYLRHPNYLVVAAEIALLPLAFGAPAITLAFTVANGALLARRIRTEDRALRGRPAEVRNPIRSTSPIREA
ncbi:MAG TPA: isoprenylcysteine carboxylmethyltransferase family protein [Stellaceae bacterium]|nr:isoprenylcysteine carboxylmethyltransferase family protein [Stellaceae bacterium]